VWHRRINITTITCLERIGRLSLNFVKIILEHGRTCSRSWGQLLKSQELRRELFDFAQISSRVWSCHSRYTANVQGQLVTGQGHRVEGQGHGVTTCQRKKRRIFSLFLLVQSFILNLRLGSSAKPFLRRPLPFLLDWLHGLSDHVMFLFCSTAGFVCTAC